jgi:carbonic anhydrase
MSEQNINISQKNIAGKCDLKCSYNFKYSSSNSTATNNGVLLTISYENGSISPVIYNEQQYNVSNIIITAPSIHILDGNTMAGEIIIEHFPVKGGNQLNVCIPFISSSETSPASKLITELIEKVSINAPSEGESTNLNINDFNLQTIVPKKPFFTYNNNNQNYIVFGPLSAIPLSSNTIKKLQQIIKPFTLATPGTNLFYNSKGPTTGISIGEGLYISCQPTGSTKEETEIIYDKQSTNIDFSNILNNKFNLLLILIIIGCILYIIIFYGISIFYRYLTSEKKILEIYNKM